MQVADPVGARRIGLAGPAPEITAAQDAFILQALGSGAMAGDELYGRVTEIEDEREFTAAMARLRKDECVIRELNPREGVAGLGRYVYRAAPAAAEAALWAQAKDPAPSQGEGTGEAADISAHHPNPQGDPALGHDMSSGDVIKIDLARLLESRLLIQAASGGGKSWTLRRLLEQTAPHVQQIILDPEGEFDSLADHYPYLVFGSEEGHLPFSPDRGRALAQELLKSRASAVIDLSDFDPEDRDEFVAEFVRGLMSVTSEHWHHVLVVIDEAHLFAPQHDKSAAKKPIIDLAGRGRKRGLCPVLATQRLSKLNKSVAAELHNRMIGFTVLDVDVRRAADELGMPVGRAGEELGEFEPGEFFIYGPALTRRITKVRVGDVVTRHGHLVGAVAPPQAPTDAIRALLTSAAATPPEKKANTPKAQPRKKRAARKHVNTARVISDEDLRIIGDYLEQQITHEKGAAKLLFYRDCLFYVLMSTLQASAHEALAWMSDAFATGDIPVKDWRALKGVSDQQEAAVALRRWLQTYVSMIRPNLASNLATDHLFVSQRGTPLSKASVYIRFQSLLEATNLTDRGYSLASFSVSENA